LISAVIALCALGWVQLNYSNRMGCDNGDVLRASRDNKNELENSPL